MNCLRPRRKPGRRPTPPADPWPGPPATRNMTPRAVPDAGSTSTWRLIVPGTLPLRSSGTVTVPHSTPPDLQGVSTIAVGPDGESVLLCVPDDAIAEVARGIDVGPWVAHVSGATPLAALDPHTRRFSVHPLQTFTRARGPEQLDGAYAAVTAETDEALALGFELARTLRLEPFELAGRRRPLFHPR